MDFSGSVVKGGLGIIYPPNEGKDYKWYILPIGWLYTTYHPLQEPEKSIDSVDGRNPANHLRCMKPCK